LVFGAIFDFHAFPKGTFWTTFSPKQAPKTESPELLGPSFSRPCFSRTRVILVPLGPSVFKNIIFPMMIGYFSVFSAFRCAMFYVIFITFVEKTSVNAQPLSPQIFMKIAPDFKNNVFYYFASLRLRFFYLRL
jgi:hypothetical protein